MPQNINTFDANAYLAAHPDAEAWANSQVYGGVADTPVYNANGEPMMDANGNMMMKSSSPYSSLNDAAFAHWQNYGQNMGYNFVNNSNPVYNDPYVNSLNLGGTEAEQLANLKNTDPNAYYNKAANLLEENIFSNYVQNKGSGDFYNQLQDIKNVNPQAYYQNQLKWLGEAAGWQMGQNVTPTAITDQIQALMPEAVKAGLNPTDITNLVNTSAAQTAANNQRRIANEASSGQGFFNGLPQFAGLIGGAALTAGALGAFDAAAAPLALGTAESGAGALPSLAWTAPEIGGGVTGSTFGTLNAALPAAGSVGGAGAGMSAALPAGVMIGDGTLGTTLGATYMAAAPGQFAVDATGAAIPASSIGFGGYAPSGTSLSDILNNLNNAKKVYNGVSSLSKALGGSSGSTAGVNGLSPQQLATLLSSSQPVQTNSYLGQIKTNQNPFLFNVPGQTTASEGMYDVSGSNLAKALRKE